MKHVMNICYMLDGHEAVSAPLLTWAQWFETANRRVADTTLEDGTRISTVFLGLDQSFGDGPPLLFETMIFGGPEDQYCERYTTWEEAEIGHAEAVLIATAAAMSSPAGADSRSDS